MVDFLAVATRAVNNSAVGRLRLPTGSSRRADVLTLVNSRALQRFDTVAFMLQLLRTDAIFESEATIELPSTGLSLS